MYLKSNKALVTATIKVQAEAEYDSLESKTSFKRKLIEDFAKEKEEIEINIGGKILKCTINSVELVDPK